MKRIIVALMVGGALFGVVLGAAASLGVSGSVIQAGTDGSLWCDGTGVQVDAWAVNDIPGPYEGVEWVTISGVDPACAGARMYVRVDDADGNVLAYSSGEPSWGSRPCYAPSDAYHWVIAQAAEPSGGYRFYLKEGDRTTQKWVAPEDIESLKVWIEGKFSDGDECTS